MTPDRRMAAQWLEQVEGAGLDGVIAKPAELTYQPGKRAMIKVKHARTADCVVAGVRRPKTGKDAVGPLLLGPYDDAGRPQDGRAVARAVRRRGARWRDREAGGAHLSTGQTRDDQGQARAHRRLRGGGVPLAQDRQRRGGLAAARPVR